MSLQSLQPSLPNGLRAWLGIGLMAGGVASSAAAVPLTYNVVVANSSITTSLTTDAEVDVNPDFLNQFPQYGVLTSSSTTKPLPSSQAIADVGLPNNSANGANGITISQLTYSTVPAVLDGFGVISVPLNVTGSTVQLVAYTREGGHPLAHARCSAVIAVDCDREWAMDLGGDWQRHDLGHDRAECLHPVAAAGSVSARSHSART